MEVFHDKQKEKSEFTVIRGSPATFLRGKGKYLIF